MAEQSVNGLFKVDLCYEGHADTWVNLAENQTGDKLQVRVSC